MKKITQKTKLSEVLDTNDQAAEILFEAGLGCVGCPMAMAETLEDGCKSHGLNKKEIDEVIKKLNNLMVTSKK
jgi:hybrid cluster-associated redox disulfide protein